jgi:hypothetical protein
MDFAQGHPQNSDYVTVSEQREIPNSVRLHVCYGAVAGLLFPFASRCCRHVTASTAISVRHHNNRRRPAFSPSLHASSVTTRTPPILSQSGSNTMGDSMPPSTPIMDSVQLPVRDESSSRNMRFATPTVKLEEGEIDESATNARQALVPYSSPYPPLIDDVDDTRLLDDSNSYPKQATDTQSLRSEYHTQLPSISANASSGELQLSTYEYVALDERYRTLSSRHNELRKVVSTCNDVIQGSSAHEDPAASIEQLRAEAGCEGLRAKALELDALRPLLRDAGGMQALTLQIQSIRPLVEQAGGLDKLKAMIMDAQMLRLEVAKVGGLQGLDNLVSQVNILRFEQREFNELKAHIDGPNGLRAKALKYDILQQAFTAIERAPTTNHTQVGHLSTGYSSTKIARSIAQARQSSPSSEASAGMHPAEALLLSAKSRARNPDRDLYEPQAFGNNTTAQHLGSNHVQIGSSRAGKRKIEDEPKISVEKRLRVDVGRASALVQAPLVGGSTAIPRSNADQLRIPMMRPASSSYNEYSCHRAQGSDPRSDALHHQIQTKTVETRSKTAETVGTAPIDARNNRSSMNDLLALSDDIRPTVTKIECVGDQRHTVYPTSFVPKNISNANNQVKAYTMIGNYPIALWVGSRDSIAFNTGEFKTNEQIPHALVNSLAAEMVKYIQNANAQLWNAMPPNRGTCILGYLIDGNRPLDQPQETRACRGCSSPFVGNHRPCALLLDIGGVRTVVFVPLRQTLREGVRWKEKKFWIVGT